MSKENTSREIKLASVINDIAAGPFGSKLKVDSFLESGFPIIDGANLKGFKVTDNVTKFVSEEKARSLARSIAKRGDVVVTISGTLGQIAYVPSNSAYDEYLCSQRQFRVTFDSDKVYVPYLVSYFHTNEGQHKILSFANQTGVPALSQPLKNFKNISVVLPPLETQRQIAAVLGALDDKIETNERIIKNLQEQEQLKYKQLFNRTVPSRIGTLGDLGTVVGGGTPSKKHDEYYASQGIPWITPKDLSLSKTTFISRGERDISQLGFQKSSTQKLPEGTVLFSSRAPIGYVAIAANEVTTNQGFKSIVPNTEIGTPFVFWTLKLNLADIESYASGSTFKEISGSVLRDVPVKIPNRMLLETFNSFCEPTFTARKNLEQQNEVLENLRDTLLPRLISSEVDVSKIQLDEIVDQATAVTAEET